MSEKIVAKAAAEPQSQSCLRLDLDRQRSFLMGWLQDSPHRNI